MFTHPALLLSAAVLALGVAACGGSSTSSSSGAGASSSAAGATSSAAGATSSAAGATSSAAGATSSAAGATGSSTSASHTSSSAAAPAGGSGTLALAANPSGSLAFDHKTLSAKAGKVTIKFTNAAALGHNLTIQQGTSGPVLGSTPTFQGGSKSVALTLKPGTYTFFCSVPGHRAGGMVGTLTVS